MKRHLVFPLQFDTRSLFLGEVSDSWDRAVKDLHVENRNRIIEGLADEFGKGSLDAKIANFREVGQLPFSIIAYHNGFFQQARNAFVIGAYYPALTGVCALAERILNHLVIDLREDYRATPSYKIVYRKSSFDNWPQAIRALAEWKVLRGAAPQLFLDLGEIRNRSLHFNPETQREARADALKALHLMARIIELQFGFFRREHWWAIAGTKGAQFISRDAEQDPFVRKYYIPQCPLVSPYYAMQRIVDGWLFVDRANHDSNELSDEEFANRFAERSPKEVVSTEIPFRPGVVPVGILHLNGTYEINRDL